MSECKTCGRPDDGHYLGCAQAAIAAPTPQPFDVTDHGLRPNDRQVDRVAIEILTAVGIDQMGDLYDALDDLIWDHYEPFQTMTDGEKAMWREAVRDAIEDGGEAPVAPVENPCAFEGCSEPRWSNAPRAQFCATHKDPKNRK